MCDLSTACKLYLIFYKNNGGIKVDNRETGEIWKTVPDYPRYEVSNYGNVKLDGFPKEVSINIGGYRKISMYQAGKNTRCAGVHRLVLENFGPSAPEAGMSCAHNDGNRSNDHISNLRWVTPKENSEDARKHRLIRQHGIEEYERVTGEQLPYREVGAIPPKKEKKNKHLAWKDPEIRAAYLG